MAPSQEQQSTSESQNKKIFELSPQEKQAQKYYNKLLRENNIEINTPHAQRAFVTRENVSVNKIKIVEEQNGDKLSYDTSEKIDVPMLSLNSERLKWPIFYLPCPDIFQSKSKEEQKEYLLQVDAMNSQVYSLKNFLNTTPLKGTDGRDKIEEVTVNGTTMRRKLFENGQYIYRPAYKRVSNGTMYCDFNIDKVYHENMLLLLRERGPITIVTKEQLKQEKKDVENALNETLEITGRILDKEARKKVREEGQKEHQASSSLF